jgi:FdhD protein
MPPPVTRVVRSAWHRQGVTGGDRIIPEETPVALTYNGGTHAVMMATPQDLEDFAVGFSLTEGVAARREDILQLDVVEQGAGVELRMWLGEPNAAALSERRRHMAGPTGCGLCGIDSLDEAVRAVRPVGDGRTFGPADIMRAIEALAPRQELNLQTRAVHAAAFWQPDAGLVAVREDVGRHNALDKLCGALARRGTHPEDGLVLLTSRVSSTWPTRSASSSRARATTRPSRARSITSRNSGTHACARRLSRILKAEVGGSIPTFARPSSN